MSLEEDQFILFVGGSLNGTKFPAPKHLDTAYENKLENEIYSLGMVHNSKKVWYYYILAHTKEREE